jgi:serine/threonine-protein kinase
MADKTIQPGTVLAGKYTVEKVIGTGGMGTVLRAHQAGLDRPVALKLLLSVHREREEFVERFYREAKAAARIRGEHVAQVFDVGKTEDGDPYLAMEFLDGEDLGDILRRERRLPLKVAIGHMMDACAGVAEAHGAQVIHRDLKPANLFVTRTGQGRPIVKIIDFGISKVDEGASKLTSTGGSLGTAYYMAPEQIERPRETDGRADIWALGVIFFELVTGGMPFNGESVPQIVAAIMKNQRRRTREYVPELPLEVDAVIDRCLALRREERFQSAGELAAAITRIPVDGSVNAAVTVAQGGAFGMQQTMAEPVGPPPPLADVPDLLLPSRQPSAPSQRAVPAAPPAPTSAPALAVPSLEAPKKQAARPPPPSGGAAPPSMGVELDPMEVADSPMLELDVPYAASRPSAGRIAPAGSVRRFEETMAPEEEGPRRFPRVLAIGLVALLVVVGASAVFAVPRIVSGRLRDAAAGGGLTLTQDSAKISASGVELTNLSATFPSAPGMTLHAKTAHVSLSGSELVLKDVDATSSSTLDELTRTFASAEPTLPKSIRADGVHIHVAISEDIALDAKGASFVDTADAVGLHTLSVTMPQTTLVTPIGDLGPFNATFNRAPEKTELRLVPLDAEPEGASAVLTWVSDALQIAVRAPRAKYHLPAKALGLAADDNLELDAKLDASVDPSGALKGTGTVLVFGVPIAGVATDVSAEMEVSGKSDAISARTKRATIGPFTGEVRGDWTKADRKQARFEFRIDPLACSEIAKVKAAKGSPDAVLARFMSYTGVAATKGQASATGTSTLAGGSPPRLTTRMSKNETCGITFFPR